MRSALQDVVLVLLSCVVAKLNGAKILAVAPFPGPSQSISIQPFLKELANRGHELTVITAFPQKKPVKNYRDIDVSEVIKLNDEIVKKFVEVKSKWGELSLVSYFGELITSNVVKNKEVQELLQAKPHFDLMIVETFYLEALFGMAEHFGAHLIGFSSFGTAPHIDDLVGNTSPISYVPHVTLGVLDRMNFCERLKNLALQSLEFVHLYTVHLPRQQKIYRELFPRAKRDLYDVRKNFALMLLNQHFSLSFPRPYVPNMIQVGGFHLRRGPPGVLPVEMQQFFNESSDSGVIYFSMGSNMKSKDLPKEKLGILMKTFASLEQRVMWKFEDPELPGKPDNVFISKWFPQNDILAHPKLKLFITHCGLLSTMEAIFYGKPVLGMPMGYDQFINSLRTEQAGFGLSVAFNELSVEEFSAKIKELIQNPKYTKNVKIISSRYHDQPMTPLDTAIFWTEYVLRHDGASHMRNAGQDLNFMQYHSLDTIATLLGGIFVLLMLIIWLVVKFIRIVLGGGSKAKLKEKRQ